MSHFSAVAMKLDAARRELLLMLKTLHDLSILEFHNSQSRRHVRSCRVFSIHRMGAGAGHPWLLRQW